MAFRVVKTAGEAAWTAGFLLPLPSASRAPAAAPPPVTATPPKPIQAPPRGPSPAKTITFSDTARQIFHRVDANGNGYLSKSEIGIAFQDPKFTGPAGAALVALKDHREDIQVLHDDEWGSENDGVTLGDLAALDAQPADQRQKLGESGFNWAVPAFSRQTRTLFPKGLASITPAAVVQGNHNNCYFLSALAALAAHDPQAIRDMIVDHGNGTVTVKFPKHPITMAMPSQAELTEAAKTSPENGMWVAVLEKAYAKYDPTADWGGLTGGIRALTGKSSSTYLAVKPFSTTSIVGPVQAAQREGRLMVASRTWSKNGDLPTQHVYSVLGYDAKTAELILRNPHGSGGPAGDGVLRMSPATFQDQFDLVAIQDR